jgi:hypothetical protein
MRESRNKGGFTMLRRWMPLLICSLFLIILGCSNLKSSEVSSIWIECVDICNREDPQAEPFTEKTFTDPEAIRAFVNAVNKASRVKGELDYGVTFRMYAAYKNGGEKVYSLNISDSKEEGIRGLLVDSNDSGKGYSIPSKNHEELRKLIYGE